MLSIFKQGFETLGYDLKHNNIKSQLANLFTLSRFFSPFVLIPLIAFNKKVLFVIAIIFFSITDALDGYYARKYKSVTLFGKYLDAFVDKIYAGSLLFPIVLFPWIEKKLLVFIWIVLGLEFGISILNLYAFYRKLNPYSNYFGKIKTTILFITMGVIYLKKFLSFSSIIVCILLIITSFFEVVTLISYFIKIKKTLKS